MQRPTLMPAVERSETSLKAISARERIVQRFSRTRDSVTMKLTLGMTGRLL